MLAGSLKRPLFPAGFVVFGVYGLVAAFFEHTAEGVDRFGVLALVIGFLDPGLQDLAVFVEFVGELWIECKDWEQGIHEIGYFVVQSETGKGIATEAARAGVRFIFEHLNAHKVALTCDEDNLPSYRVAEAAGFVREGHIRDAVQRPDGSRVGTLIYGLLRSEVG